MRGKIIRLPVCFAGSRPAMTRLALAPPSIAVVSFDHRCTTPIPHVATGRPSSSLHRSPSKQAFNAPRQQTASVEIPIASDARPRHTSRGFHVWGFFCQGVRQSGKSFVLRQFLCSISKPVSSSRPAGSLTSSRAGAVKVGRRTNLAACSELARPYLDSFEHDGTLGAIGMTIRGEPAFGRGSIAPQPCIRWVQGPEP